MDFSKKSITDLNDIYAQLLWLQRGPIYDNNTDRINDDYLDARRIVGCKLADDIISMCMHKENSCKGIPEHYFPSLCSISLMEFKKIMAYFLWVKKYNRIETTDQIKEQIYLDACEKIENSCINCTNKAGLDIPDHIMNFLMYSKKTQFSNMIKRKAYWNGSYENSDDFYYNWKKAEKFVKAVYDPFEAPDKLTKNDIIKVVSAINENHHLASLFEYCIRCCLMKRFGIALKKGASFNNGKLYIYDIENGSPILN